MEQDTERDNPRLSDLKTSVEVAKILGLSYSGFAGWMQKGKAKPVKEVGGTKLFDKAEIDRLLGLKRGRAGGKRPGAGRKKQEVTTT